MASGKYRVRVDWKLEDLSGNNLLRRFEVEVTDAKLPAFIGPRHLQFELK